MSAANDSHACLIAEIARLRESDKEMLAACEDSSRYLIAIGDQPSEATLDAIANAKKGESNA